MAAPSRHFPIDTCGVMPVGSDHRANEEGDARHSAKNETSVAKSEQDWSHSISAPALFARAGRRVSDHRIQSRAKKPAPSALDNNSDCHSETFTGTAFRVSLMEVQREHAPHKSMRACLTRVLHGLTDVVITATGKRLNLSGLFLCRSPTCSFCAGKRAAETADTLSRGMRRAIQKGYMMRMLTLTIPTGVGVGVGDQKALLHEAKNIFQRDVSNLLRRFYGASVVGLAWSYDITIRYTHRGWGAHLHMHCVLVSDGGHGIGESRLFGVWRDAVAKVAPKVSVSSKGFYARSPASEKQASRYIMGKFLKGAMEVAGTRNKHGRDGAMGWFQFLQYIKATGDLGAVALYQSVIAAFKRKHWSNTGKVFGALADEFVSEPDEEGQQEEPEEHLLTIKGWEWQALASIRGGIETLFMVLEARDRQPNRLAFIREWIGRMRAANMPEDDIRAAWRFALGL
jgi:hypothetical protein